MSRKMKGLASDLESLCCRGLLIRYWQILSVFSAMNQTPSTKTCAVPVGDTEKTKAHGTE